MHSKQKKKDIIDYINFSINKDLSCRTIEWDSQGLILLANDGEAANQIMKRNLS